MTSGCTRGLRVRSREYNLFELSNNAFRAMSLAAARVSSPRFTLSPRTYVRDVADGEDFAYDMFGLNYSQIVRFRIPVLRISWVTEEPTPSVD